MRTNFSNKFILLRIFRWSVHSFHVRIHICSAFIPTDTGGLASAAKSADPSDLHKKKILGFGSEMERE